MEFPQVLASYYNDTDKELCWKSSAIAPKVYFPSANPPNNVPSPQKLQTEQYDHTCQPKIFFCRTKFHILQDFSRFCRTPPVFLTYLKYYWPYTSNTLNSSILYQNARHKFCRTLSRICRTAGYLRQKSRTVGNYVSHYLPDNTCP